MSRYDVVVIGGGAAGLSAALVLSRGRRKVLVVDAGEPRNAPATHMHGYVSRDGMPPTELLATGRSEVRRYGGEIVSGTVTDLVPDGRTGFWVLLGDGQRISARRLLVTTGLPDELPTIPGLADRWARDVLHCPYCHWHEVRDRQLGVIGGSIDQLVIDVDDHLRGVQLADGCVVPRDALFVPPHFVANNTLLVGLGAPATRTAGSPSMAPDARAWLEFGPPATPSTPAPGS